MRGGNLQSCFLSLRCRYADLKNDFEKMKVTILGTLLSWEEIVDLLKSVANEINAQ